MTKRNLKYSIQQPVMVNQEIKNDIELAAFMNDESCARLCRRAIIKEINFIKESNK